MRRFEGPQDLRFGRDMLSSVTSSTRTVSHAAALALQQLQEQLSSAYIDINKLQDEKAELRVEAKHLADQQQEEIQNLEDRNATMAHDLSDMHAILQVRSTFYKNHLCLLACLLPS